MTDSIRDPLSGRRQWLLAGGIFFVATWVFLWPALTPWTMHHRLQTLDALFSAWTMGHSSFALFGARDFWNAGMFYPIENALCLSDPMLIQAVVMAPAIHLLGVPFAYNLWILFCWFSMGLCTWAYLTHRGLSFMPALFGGMFVAFSPDRYFHLGGHAHLFYQASFPLVLLAVERASRPGGSHWWGTLFGLSVLLQVFSGFYMTLLFGLWCVVLLPVSAWLGSEGSARTLRRAVLRQGPQIAAWILVTAGIFAPIAKQYSEFGKDFPTMNLTVIDRFSADWSGYLLPPTLPGKIRTLSGSLIQPFVGTVDRGENNQYLGLAAPLLLASWLLLAWRRGLRPERTECVWWTALALLALGALVLSFGPLNPAETDWFSPYSLLFAWLEPVRFFRSPARFAFLVEWALAFGAAFALHRVLSQAGRAGLPIAVGAFALLVVDFLPTTALDHNDVRKDGLVEYLLEEEDSHPLVELPVFDEIGFLSRALWHYKPLANGYSGYVPQGRQENLVFLEAEFPSAESLILLKSWNVDRVFVSRDQMADRLHEARNSPNLTVLWDGPEGVLFQAALREFPTTAQYLDHRRELAFPDGTTPGPIVMIENFLPSRPIRPTEMEARGSTEADRPLVFKSTGQGSALVASFRSDPIHPAVYRSMKLRIRVDNWYRLIEEGGFSWATERFPQFGRYQTVHFVVPADGHFHEIEVDLTQSMAWNAEDPAIALRIELGKRPGNEYTIEWLKLESQ